MTTCEQMTTKEAVNPHKVATDPILTNAVNAYLKARAIEALERERVAPIHAELLAAWKPTNTRTGEPITDLERLYLCDDDDLCADLYRDMDRLYREAGWKGLEPGQCPALIAHHLTIRAGHGIIEAMRQWFPAVTPNSLVCIGIEQYRRYIDLAVGLVVNHPGYRKPAA